MWHQLSPFPSSNAAIAMQHHPGNIHQSVATPATPWYVLIQLPNVIDTISIWAENFGRSLEGQGRPTRGSKVFNTIIQMEAGHLRENPQTPQQQETLQAITYKAAKG